MSTVLPMIKNTNKKSSTSQEKITPYKFNADDPWADDENGAYTGVHLTSMIDADGAPVVLNDRGYSQWEKLVDKIPPMKKGHVSEYNKKVIERFYPPGPGYGGVPYTVDERGYSSIKERNARRAYLIAATMGEFFEFLEKPEQKLIAYFLDQVNTPDVDLDTRLYLDITVDKVNEVTGLKLKNSVKAYQFLWNLSLKYFCRRRQSNQRQWIELLYSRTNDPDKLLSDTFCLTIHAWYPCDFYQIVEYINDKRALNKSLGKIWP